MEATATLRCRGHPLVTGSHPTTFEVTAGDQLTEKGTCIIAVGADSGCAGLPEPFRKILAHDDAVLVTTLACGGAEVTIRSRGSARFTLDHPADLVWRRSPFVCGRTIGILSDRVAATLPRELIGNLSAGKEMVVTLCVRRPG
ncbi:MAG TPA: DUF371 domain-containing protein [Methanoregula sp.]|nr:DUF371 domain-containing protein [Methanoregula sp.]